MPIVHDENHYANIIKNSIRNKISDRSHTRMQNNGRRWRNFQGDYNTHYVNSLSKINLRRLRSQLRTLSDLEDEFFERFLSVPLFATHTTDQPVKNQQGTVSLFSRQKLIDRGILFNLDNSPQEDIRELGNDDFVFFSLEAGYSSKKESSRFGGTSYRFNLNEKIFAATAWLSLVEMRFAKTPFIKRHIESLPDSACERVSQRILLPAFDIVFSGLDMRPGIALSIIRDVRVHLKAHEKDLLRHDDITINNLINGLYRPEIKVARHFFCVPYNEAQVKKDNKF